MKHASLFSGIGGPEVAAAMLGWDNAFHCEINPFGKAILEYWFPNSVSYEDITKTDFREWRGKIDVITGGFPCQPFSYAGKRGGSEDERYLWPQMLRAIEEVRPTWVIGENVAGLATMVEGGALSYLGSETTLFGESDEVHGYLLRETFTIERICRDLERIGYSVQPVLIPAAAVGAPHRRDRIFIIAYNAANTEGTKEGRGEGAGDDALRSRGDSGEEDTGSRYVVDPVSVRWSERTDDNGLFKTTQQEERREFKLGGTDRPQDRWREFPSVSPVHRGNDGLPFNVDDLTIPFAKWRIESLKAYGNAIVPQVMYEIFRAIEELSK